MPAVANGAVSVSLGDVVDALRGRGDPTAIAIVRDLRLPRVILGALVGAGLGASGAALQGSLRNPLAEPYLLGVSGGAAVGAVIAFAFGVTSDALITLAAFAGGIGAVFVALAVSRVGGRGTRGDMRTLLIAGVIVGAFANAAIMVALARAEPNTVRGALWWMMTPRGGVLGGWPPAFFWRAEPWSTGRARSTFSRSARTRPLHLASTLKVRGGACFSLPRSWPRRLCPQRD